MHLIFFAPLITILLMKKNMDMPVYETGKIDWQSCYLKKKQIRKQYLPQNKRCLIFLYNVLQNKQVLVTEMDKLHRK